MRAFDDPGGGHIKLGDFRKKDRLLPLHVAGPWFPGNARVVRGREHQRGDGVAAAVSRWMAMACGESTSTSRLTSVRLRRLTTPKGTGSTTLLSLAPFVTGSS